MLSKHLDCISHIVLSTFPIGSTTKISSVTPVIVSDSTIINSSDRFEHYGVLCGQELVGLAIGQYGKGFFDGAFAHVPKLIMPLLDSERRYDLRVGYVPARDFKEYPYEEHDDHQKRNLGNTCVCAPTINTFAKVYKALTGGEMMKNKGVHMTEPGRRWFAWALATWAIEHDVDVMLCVGWNAGAACKQKEIMKQITLEYERQAIMVKEICRHHEEIVEV